MSSHPHRWIYLYHGSLPPKLKDKLDYIACSDEEQEAGKPPRWFWDGSLCEFNEKWPGIFYVTQAGDIFVTQHNSWGQR
jgi:hypothetical protein